MDPDVLTFAGVAAVCICSLAALAAIAAVFFRVIKRSPPQRDVFNRLDVEQRFDQLQQSVDAIAVEVERIAEAQRFSAKLLAERPESRALSG
jgi:carboxylesterase type B